MSAVPKLAVSAFIQRYMLPEEIAEKLMTGFDYDRMDYEAGLQMGLCGRPEPYKLNVATWHGWRDGASRSGYLPLCGPFARVRR